MPVAQVYEVQPGDTLSKIAQKFGVTLDALRTANQQITNPDLIMIGDQIKIPTEAPAPLPPAPAPGHPTIYDGIHPAPGTISTSRAALITPPLTNDANNRSADVYAQVINQFAVGNNPRYLPGQGNTYCNIFVWDVTRALGAEIPHWLNAAGQRAAPFSPGAHEVNINGGIDWMHSHGVPEQGWRSATDVEAQNAANAGQLAVVLWKNPIHHGHTAIVRPGTITAKGPATAQAGAINFNMGHMKDGFHDLPGKYFIHA
ncbi:MAG: LysM peptidoglycan-binding domain-containing protein [Pyrinomonadaceae bacterium]